MKNISLPIYVVLLIILVLSGCTVKLDGSEIETEHSTTVPPSYLTRATLSSMSTTSTVTTQPFQTSVLTPTSTVQLITTPDDHPEARLYSQCLDVVQIPVEKIELEGVLVFAKMTKDYTQPDVIYLRNLSTNKDIQIKHENIIIGERAFSPDRKRMAYINFIHDMSGNVTRREIPIINADGQQEQILRWENDWVGFGGWLDNQHLVFDLRAQDQDELSMRKPGRFLVLDLATGERITLDPDFPNYLFDPSVVLPDWEGWVGVMYDPTLKYAIYPRSLDPDRFTYAIWDLSQQQIVAMLDKVFTAYSLSLIFPIPRWSPDGSRFIFRGQTDTNDQTVFELYRVDRKGVTEQITQLSSLAYIWDQNYNWSPDGRYVSIILGPPSNALNEKARLAVLNTSTLEITDYCFPLIFMGEGYRQVPPRNAIWSPDSKQILVENWYEKDHRKIIMVDISKGIAFNIAEDLIPIGWMVEQVE